MVYDTAYIYTVSLHCFELSHICQFLLHIRIIISERADTFSKIQVAWILTLVFIPTCFKAWSGLPQNYMENAYNYVKKFCFYYLETSFFTFTKIMLEQMDLFFFFYNSYFNLICASFSHIFHKSSYNAVCILISQ